MNFISTFDELNKLYEDFTTPDAKKLKAEVIKNLSKSYREPVNNFDFVIDGDGGVTVDPKAGTISVGTRAVNSGAREIAKIVTAELERLTLRIEEACAKKKLTEDEEPDDVAIETPVEDEEIEIVDDEPKQVIIECSKCGALIIKDEADIAIDEETDLVNVDDKCSFCDETEGYKIIGVVAPYKVTEDEAEVEPEVEEILEELPEDDEDFLDEGIADWYRKKFDKPADWKTQQKWEETIFDLEQELANETDPKKKDRLKQRIKQFEAKFAQQRDWEARHANDKAAPQDDEELEELFNIAPAVNLNLDGGTGNDVSVLGR